MTTGHRVVSPEQPGSAGYVAVRERSEALLRGLSAGLPKLVAGGRGELTMTTLGELARAGVVAIMQGPLKMPDEGDLPMLTAQDLLFGRGPSGRTGDVAGQVRVEAGDVVAPLIAGSGPVRRGAGRPAPAHPGRSRAARPALPRRMPARGRRHLDQARLLDAVRSPPGAATPARR
ncbi:hypothetical protein AAH991_37170 [Microbispora sp. ZYX-F-249]|uniref:Uncharacterized protein n=1 Tax=Microbispora maris TaxID=3144104 RepID=A0ABV0AZX4_9ACTN